MNRNLLVRLHRAGPWVITAIVVAFVAVSPLLFRTGTGNSWVMRWLIVGGIVILLALIYAALSYGVLTTETRIGLAIAQAQESGKLHNADDGEKDPYATPVPGSADALREENSVRTTLLALGRKVQASAHRIQEEAGRMVQRHQADPDVLETSMRVDHAAAQQARLAQSIATLCGVPPGQQWHDPLPLADVVRAAAGRITAYQRVVIEGDPAVAVEGAAAEALIHLTAELLANATQSSPPGTQVVATLRSVHTGAAIEIDDAGVGMDEADMARAREIVSGRQPMGIVDLGEVPQTGLAVVGAYSRRHGFRVDLTDSVHGGVRAVVLVPSERLVVTGEPSFDGAQMFPDASGPQAAMTGMPSGMQQAPLGAMPSGSQQAPMQGMQSGIQQAPMGGQIAGAQPMQPLPQGMPQRQRQQPPAAQQSFPQGRPQVPQGQGRPQSPAPQQGLRMPERSEIPDYPDFSNLPSAPSVQEPPERSVQRPPARPVRQMRPMERPQANPAPPQRGSNQSAPALPTGPGEATGEAIGYTPDGLPQRRSRRSEAPPPDQNFFTRRQVDTTPEPTAEQAGSWMSSFLGAGSDSPTPDHDDWSNR